MLPAILAGCGGGSSSGGGTQPPPPAEILYASGWSQITALSINTNTGALSPAAAESEPNNTVGIVATPSASFLYASDKGNGIDGFTIGQNGTLSPINGSPWPGPGNYYGGALSIDPAGKFVYAANAASPGYVAGFTVSAATGALTAMAGSPFPAGVAPFQPVVDRSGKFLYVTDYLDPQGGIYAFGINPSTGVLTSIAGSPFPTLPAAEPLGLVTDPSGKFLYASLSAGYSIAAFTIDSTTGALTSVPGSPFPTGAGSGPGWFLDSITIDPSAKFFYALSSSGFSSVVSVFTIDSSSGALTSVDGSPFPAEPSGISGGLVVEPSGKFLYIAGGGDSDILPMSIDGTTGAVTALPGYAIGLNAPIFSTNLTVALVP
jgi:6-phosphogluconolactonase (cycloisomerase 2 family)